MDGTNSNLGGGGGMVGSVMARFCKGPPPLFGCCAAQSNFADVNAHTALIPEQTASVRT
jgi:hypothetical protein